LAWLDAAAPYLVRLGSVIYLIIALGLLVWERVFLPQSHLGLEGVTSVVLAVLAAQGVKRLIRRPRPYLILSQMRRPDPGLFIPKSGGKGGSPWQRFLATLFRTSTTSNRSCPSGHIATAVSLAMVVSWHFPAAAVLGFLYALVLGYTRVYVGVHFPGDILAGILTGLVTGTLSTWLI